VERVAVAELEAEPVETVLTVEVEAEDLVDQADKLHL